jgi:hypothetical protein
MNQVHHEIPKYNKVRYSDGYDKPAAMLQQSNILFFPEAFQYLNDGGAVGLTLEGTLYWIAGIPGVLLGMILMAVLLARADTFILRRRDLLGFAFYTNLFLFAAFVTEMVDLHLDRFLLRGASWCVLLLICVKKSEVPGAQTRELAATTHAIRKHRNESPLPSN